jgi:hypothetical protein
MPQPPRPPIQTVVGDISAIRHEPLGEGRPDEVLVDITCPDCATPVRWPNIPVYPNGGIACACPGRTWNMQAVTNLPPRHGPRAGPKGKGE